MCEIDIVDDNYKLAKDWIQGEEVCWDNESVVDVCQMIDWCYPNPCHHSATCHQNSMEFFCDCSQTGYAVCHTSKYPLSCLALKNVQSVQQRVDMHIDVDGSGPLKPFPVVCEFYSEGRVITTLGHSQEQTTTVDGFQEPGSFEQTVMYDTDLMQVEALLNRSHSCWQRLSYSCRAARLLNSPSELNGFRPFSW